MAKGKELDAIISIAGEVSPSLGKAIDKASNYLHSAEGKAFAAKAAVAAAGTAIATAAVAATKALVDMGDQYNKTMDMLSMQTGAVGADLEGLEDIANNIYVGNFGEDLNDVTASLATAKQNTGLLGDELQSVTEGALSLRDVFGYDVTETTRAAKAMMQNFGISGDEAMSMIAAGAQNGLDYSGELIDSINEYSVQFAKVGLDADAMFQIFQSGADSSAWNLDKVGDAVKEFSIRAIDGSKTTISAYETLGLNADEMMKTFAKGGDGAEQAFKQVTQALVNMDDEVARDAAGVQLFGTMWEDLGVDAVAAMAGAEQGAYDVNNALDGITEKQNQNLGSMFDGIKRSIEMSVMPAASQLSDKFMELQPQIQSMVDSALPYIEDLANGLADMVGGAVDFIVNIDEAIAALKPFEPLIAGIATAVSVYMAATKGAAVAQAIHNGAMAFGTSIAGGFSAAMAAVNWQFLAIAAVIGLVIAAGVWLYQNWDWVMQKASELGAWLSAVWSNIVSTVTSAASAVVDWVSSKWNALVTTISNIWNNILSFLTGIWDNIKSTASNFVTGVVDTISNTWSTLTDILSAPFDAVMRVVDKVKDAIGGLIGKITGAKNEAASITIPAYASGGFTNGISIAGEAGTEAIISFDPRYRAQNLEYWAQAGRMLGADVWDFSLTGSTRSSQTVEIGDVNFSPNITIKGNANEDDIISAIRKTYPEFMDLIDEILFDRERGVYA